MSCFSLSNDKLLKLVIKTESANLKENHFLIES